MKDQYSICIHMYLQFGYLPTYTGRDYYNLPDEAADGRNALPQRKKNNKFNKIRSIYDSCALNQAY